jgi:hypothetical protein
MENSSENQLAIIILKIGFHLELTITSTSVVVLSLLWPTLLQAQLVWNLLQRRSFLTMSSVLNMIKLNKMKNIIQMSMI